MRLYFYCEANYIIYTEREMEESKLPPCRFVYIGRHDTRQEAEEALLKAHPEWDVCHSKPW